MADESCDFTAVRALRAAGFEVSAVAELHRGRLTTACLTDKDFGRLVYASALDSAGLILIRFPASVRGALGPSIVDLANRKPDLTGCFVVMQPGRVRIRRPRRR